MLITESGTSVTSLSKKADILVTWHMTVSGENGDLLGVDETPVTNIRWIAIQVAENKIIREGEFLLCEEKGESESDDVKGKDSREPRCTLKEAAGQFEEIVEDLSSNDRVVQLICENGLHLRQCLVPRAYHQELTLAEVFLQYYDVRKEYKAFLEKPNAFKTLEEIAEDMQIENIDLSTAEKRSRFCARIVQHLLKEGHKFNRLERVSVTLNDGMTSGYVKDDTVVRARGLPWQVSDVDVAEFFTGLNIAKGGVALCLNLKGRRNGEALVRFECSEHRDMALRRHKHHLLGRYIEVYKGTAQEFLKIAKGPASAMHTAADFLANGGDVIIRMRGLPFDATAQDILTFFGEAPAVYRGEEGVMLISYPDGASTGDAFVLFSTEQEGQTALKKHRENIGKRYVELFRSTRAELQQVLTMYNIGYQLVQPTAPFNMLNDRSVINQRLQALMNMSCLRLRGLPFSASHKDILSFLGSYKDHVVGTVHIIFNLQGRPSGEAFVQLQTPDQAHQCANERHLKHMGERYIEVFQCSVQDMTWMLATSHANQLASQQLNHKLPKPTYHAPSTPAFHPSTPSPPPPLIQTTSAPNMITPPPITTSQPILAPLSPIPIYTGQFPPMMTPLPAGFLPPPHLPPHAHAPHGVTPYIFNQEPFPPFPMNHFNKGGVTYIAFTPPPHVGPCNDDRIIHNAFHEKHHRHHHGHHVPLFYAH